MLGHGRALRRMASGRVGGLVREKIPMFAAVAASSLVTLVVQSAGDSIASFEARSLSLRAANAMVSALRYMANGRFEGSQAYIHQALGVNRVQPSLVNEYFYLFSDIGTGITMGLGQINTEVSFLGEGGRDHEKYQHQKHHIDKGCQVDVDFH